MQKLTVGDLEQARRLLGSDNPGGMYDFLSAKGYKYATLANGVAKGNSVAGAVAINFMMETASELGVSLSPELVGKIKFDLAEAYLKKLEGYVSRSALVPFDISFEDAWSIHTEILLKYGLSAEAWTLNNVFLILKPGSQATYWTIVLDSAGNLQYELRLAAQTDVLMSMASAIGPEENRKLARSWIDRVDSPSGTLTFLSSLKDQLLSSLSELFGEPSEIAGDTSPINYINIEITPDPQPQQNIPGENQAREDVSNGFTQNAATHKVSFSDQTLNNVDFTSVQLGSLATGGIRPGEIQLDPNVRPNEYLSQFYLDSRSSEPDFSLRNAVILNGLAALTTVNTYVDPLLLDLTGDGVQMTPISDGVLFDTDHSGTLKRSGWADRTTGILVVDDGSGQIKDVSQMFSEYFRGALGGNGQAGEALFKDGFAALASVDGNADQVINSSDEIWSQLRVWVDASHDGKSDAGELKTLAELGITQINVTATPVSGDVRQGNSVIARGSFLINGASREALAVNFLGDPVSNTLTVEGTGSKVVSTTGAITTTAYASSSNADEVLDAGQLGVTNLYAGSGNDSMTAAATGSWLVGGAGSNTYNGGPGDDVFVVSASDNPNDVHGNGGRDTALIVGDEGMALNMAKAGLTIAQGGRGHAYIVGGGHSSVFIKGGSGGSTLIGGAGNDVLVGGSGRNTIIGGSGKAVIFAGPKGDAIMASAGGSIIHAGGGVDRIYGGAGPDVIEAGHGDAVIDGGAGINLVALHGKYGDYTITRTDSGFTVADKVSGRDGSLTLSNVQKLNFADISVVDLQQPNAMPVADALRLNQAGSEFDRTQPQLISAASILANDQRLNSQGNLRIASVSDPLGGSVSLTEQGDVLFTPDPRFTGIANFKYGVADEAGNPAALIVDLNTGELAPMRAIVSLLTPEVPTDPLTSRQWYLSDIDVLPVWKDYTGKGVRIGQFEPGGLFSTAPEIFDTQHPDLAANVDQSWLQSQRAAQTLPSLVSDHATMVAGIMVAAKNTLGGIGIAHEATLGGHYLANSGADLTGMGKMLGYDITNHSWGFTKDFAQSNLQGGRVNTISALMTNTQYVAESGRGGLGTVIVTAGGNNRASGGSAQGSFINSNRFSIQVGAFNNHGDLSTLESGAAPFSNPGASLLVSAPGSNVWSTSYILETERGSTFGNDYSAMKGTSFAAPIVSGVVALMLQANPNLGYRDVQQILAVSARRVEDGTTQWADNGARNWNGGGMHASHDYGFGKVDARAAVRLAESWTPMGSLNKVSATGSKLAQLIGAGESITTKLQLRGEVNIEHVEVDFDSEVGRLGDLVVKLIAPNGTRSVLLNRAGKAPIAAVGATDTDVGSTQAGTFKYTFMSTHHRGENWTEQQTGDWTLEVTNAANGLPVTLNSWALRLFGSDPADVDTYFYTDEFADSVVRQNARAILADGSGRNTINAAAVSGDVSIDLSTGTALIAGAALSVSNVQAIQSLFSGDGNDTLVAGPSDSLLSGGRGSNTLVGGAGKDLYVVHRRDGGVDTLVNLDSARGEVINLVGFKGKGFDDLLLTQQGADVLVELGNDQSLVLKNQLVASLDVGQFKFQATFIAPLTSINPPLIVPDVDLTPAVPVIVPDMPGTVTLRGGAKGVGLSSDETGLFVASLKGKLYSHDGEPSDTFVVAKQEGVSDYKNALRGFRQGVDKIDLSQTGITDFSALTISKQNRSTINNISMIHGVEVSTAQGTDSKITLLYLDGLEVSQLSESDFIFARPQAETIVRPISERLTVAENWMINPSSDLSPGDTPAGEQTVRSEAFTSRSNADVLVQAMASFAPQSAAALTFTPMDPGSLHPTLAANAA
ncbi:S8 family serine peptidase [Pseudomonas mandelii]|uniref:S8 family serine peptidase n=1 Tax=Pseudomonas mandelii TaxID=75612 RepID=UPI00224A67B6|nr:S8 family serine peptidase [Pseudomonas mandelii]MCX2898529.1 S8 family serine peptidase [Pseudomonas mandelii]